MPIAAGWLGSVRAQPAITAPAEPDYRGLVQRYVPAPLAGSRPGYADRIQRGPLRRHCEEMAAEAWLSHWTARTDYSQAARERLAALMDVWQIQRQPGHPWKRVCFFSLYPIMDTYRILSGDGQLDADSRRRFREFAREACFPLETGVFNQSLARSAGLALAAKLLPELAEAPGWRKAAEEIWDEWQRRQDTTENAACYNGISLTFLWLLHDALDRADLGSDPAARRMFARFRDQVSPLGVVPEYGDSGDADWGTLHCWGNWVAAFERAARVFHDPTYRWPAVRMFQAAGRHRAIPSPAGGEGASIDAMSTAYALCLADQWRDAGLVPRPCEAASDVLYRVVDISPYVAHSPDSPEKAPKTPRTQSGGFSPPAVPDKLILAPSRRPGDPFVMAELFARSYHAHEDQLGAVLYYEFEDVPLLHGLGYHNRAAEEANLLLMSPPDDPFPHKPAALAPGVWHGASLPLRELPAVAQPGGQNLRHFDKLTFRVEEDEPVNLYVANLRLSGPSGDRLLDDFQKHTTWRGGRQAIVPGPAGGQQAMRVSLPRGASFVWRAGFDASFSLGEFDRIKFDWMIEGVDRGWSKSLILRVDASPTDFHVPLRPQGAHVVRARTEAHGGDQFGQFEAAGWFTDDSRLVRRMLLLREGALLVTDDLMPGPQADGWTAGPLWHLFARPLSERPQSGPAWFDAPGRRHLLVWLEQAPGRSMGVETVRLWSGVEPYTVFAKQRLKAGRSARFVTVLVPHRPEIEAAPLAAGITLHQSDGGRLDLRLALPAGAVDVQIDPEGQWKVVRP